MLNKILKLGDPRLYERSSDVLENERLLYQDEVLLLFDLILAFRTKYKKGRAIAAPQIGLMKRIVCFHIQKPVVMYNPVLSKLSAEKMELWDDCMSFPNLLVKVQRHKSCTLQFRDQEWNLIEWNLTDDLSELFQHECDHLDGILATQRAIDQHSFKMI